MASYCRSPVGIIVCFFNLIHAISSLGSDNQTTLSIGSLLDDDAWHDVSISHANKDISLSVDRVTVHKIAIDDFSQLNLDKFVSID